MQATLADISLAFWRKKGGELVETEKSCHCADPTCLGNCPCRTCAGSGAASRHRGFFCPVHGIELRGPEGRCPRCKEAW